MDTTINSHLKSLSVANQNKFDSKITNNEFLLGKFFTPKKHTCPKPYKSIHHSHHLETKTAKLLANQLNYIKP